MKKSILLSFAAIIGASALSCQKINSFSSVAEKKPKVVFVSKGWCRAAINKLKYFESYRATPYICSGGVRTIGYGTTRAPNKKIISKNEAEALLVRDLMEARKIVLKMVHVPLTKRQEIALSSFTHNCGIASLKRLVSGAERLNGGNYASVPRLLPLYCKAGGRELNGLKKRRAWEADLWEGKILF